MFAALDVHYGQTYATTACVLFSSWDAETADDLLTVTTPIVADYKPGHFFHRELPCLLNAIEKTSHSMKVVVVDAYVWLGQDRPGLGWYLFDALQSDVAVIGVAKNAFAECDAAVPVYRGQSKKPLYVTAQGIALKAAAEHIAGMHGPHRIPTLLKLADRLARSHCSEDGDAER